jgi:hypothetical protein
MKLLISQAGMCSMALNGRGIAGKVAQVSGRDVRRRLSRSGTPKNALEVRRNVAHFNGRY